MKTTTCILITFSFLLQSLVTFACSEQNNLSIDLCPPLYKPKDSGCSCNKRSDFYHFAFFKCGTTECQAAECQAFIRLGYWIGYADDNYNHLLIGYCPSQYCAQKATDGFFYELPKEAEELDRAVCSNSRQGRLCGECVNDTTVHFHSSKLKCGSTKTCHLAPLYYLLSEIAPLTLLFLFIIIFNVRFTSGAINGFIFFVQIMNSISDIGDNFIKSYTELEAFQHFFFGLLNLNFFEFDQLTFCLWKNANALDMLMMKYVTIVYAFFLVLGTVWIINICGKFKCIRPSKLRYSVIQGLSAFIVMVYSQCIELSYSILNPIYIYNGTDRSVTVAFLQGNMEYFSSEHLPYALPALIFITIFSTFLPILLIAYPLCNKVTAFLRIQESSFIRFTSNLIPISKIKPFLDSFQGSFKDNYRFYAGLYFVYRTTILASRFAPTVNIILMILEIQIIAMLTLHSVTWPYQKKIHNIIDTLLFADLAFIVLLKLFHIILSERHKEDLTILIHTIKTFKAILSCLPLFVIAIYLVVLVIRRLKNVYKQRKTETELSDAVELDDWEDTRNELSNSYSLIREKKLDMHKI